MRARACSTGLSRSPSTPLSCAPQSLSLSPALPAPESGRTFAFALRNLGNAVLCANRATLSGISAMHPAVLNRIDGLKMVRPAARWDMARVMNMKQRRRVQGLVNKTVNSLQSPVDPDLSVTAKIPRSIPNPAIAVGGDALVEPLKIFMNKHGGSILSPGFMTITGPYFSTPFGLQSLAHTPTNGDQS